MAASIDPVRFCFRSGAKSHSSPSARREEERRDAHGPAAAMTGVQVEAALNRKNVEVLQGEEHVATVLPDETIGEGALDGGQDASWVPDQDTGVFGPAHVDTHGGGSAAAPPHLFGGATAATTEGSAASSAGQDTGAFVAADADADADAHGGGAQGRRFARGGASIGRGSGGGCRDTRPSSTTRSHTLGGGDECAGNWLPPTGDMPASKPVPSRWRKGS